MKIRLAKVENLEEIHSIYGRAIAFMRENGNHKQWTDRPTLLKKVERDIALGQCYLWTDNGEILGVFSVIHGEDPVYKTIYNGEWLNLEPYVTLHRIASSGKRKGLFSAAVEFCKTRCDNIKIATHEDNIIMRNAIFKHGFKRCGTIRLEDGDERIAYHLKVLNE